MGRLQVSFIVLIICLGARGMMNLRRGLTPAKEARRPDAFRLPADLRSADISNLRIPNSELCDQMKLDPAQHYIVLPWWYEHCQQYKEKKAKKYNHKFQNLQYYIDTLKRLNDAKKLAKKRQSQLL